ncbi:MAG: hypothetical protein CL609_16035 [Anaerolineaceae bacterium]|nr:hypothetical protein [Anaerolineaceae bacterium]
MTNKNKINNLFFEKKEETAPQGEESKPAIEIRYGSICPKCLKGIFDYDGLLNLVCPNCGFTAGGCFT